MTNIDPAIQWCVNAAVEAACAPIWAEIKQARKRLEVTEARVEAILRALDSNVAKDPSRCLCASAITQKLGTTVSDPRYAHEYLPRRKDGKCKNIVGSESCHLMEDALVHTRWAPTQEDASEITDAIVERAQAERWPFSGKAIIRAALEQEATLQARLRPGPPTYTYAEAISGSYFEGRSYVELTEDVIDAAKAAWLNDFGVPRHSSAYAYLCELFSLEVLA